MPFHATSLPLVRIWVTPSLLKSFMNPLSGYPLPHPLVTETSYMSLSLDEVLRGHVERLCHEAGHGGADAAVVGAEGGGGGLLEAVDGAEPGVDGGGGRREEVPVQLREVDLLRDRRLGRRRKVEPAGS